MKRIPKLLAVLGALMFTVGITVRAEEPEKPKEGAVTIGVGDGGVTVQTGDGKKPADAAQGGGRRGGPGGPGGAGGMFGSRDIKETIANMLGRAVGVDVGARSAPKVDTLPLGADRTFVLNVPVGGIESFAVGLPGYKMEAIFKLTEEQTKAVTGLRDEYTTEQKKLEQELADQQKALAEKARQLRLKFEQRANDILTGADKEAKEKIDAMARETHAKDLATVTDAVAKTDTTDWQKAMAQVQEIQKQVADAAKATQAKVLEALPAEARATAEALFAQQQALRDQARQGFRGNNPGAGRRNAGGEGKPGESVKPPRPPSEKPAGEF